MARIKGAAENKQIKETIEKLIRKTDFYLFTFDFIFGGAISKQRSEKRLAKEDL